MRNRTQQPWLNPPSACVCFLLFASGCACLHECRRSFCARVSIRSCRLKWQTAYLRRLGVNINGLVCSAALWALFLCFSPFWDHTSFKQPQERCSVFARHTRVECTTRGGFLQAQLVGKLTAYALCSKSAHLAAWLEQSCSVWQIRRGKASRCHGKTKGLAVGKSGLCLVQFQSKDN